MSLMLCQQLWGELEASRTAQQGLCPKPPTLQRDEGTTFSSSCLLEWLPSPFVHHGQLAGVHGSNEASPNWGICHLDSPGGATQTKDIITTP